MHSKNMSAQAMTALAAGAAGALYYYNARTGKRHRAELADGLQHARRKTREEVIRGVRDAAHRVSGKVAEVRGRLQEGEVDERVLRERVRATIGHYCSHPSAIDVSVDGRKVSLRGPVLQQEAKALLRAVRTVRGVEEVEDQLRPCESAAGEPALQGQGRLPGHPPFRRQYWPPAYRLGLGLIGGSLWLYGLSEKGVLRLPLSLAGGALLARAVFNRELRSLAGFGRGHTVSIQKAITVQAPVERVFDLWKHPENFPRFMHFVRNVDLLPDGGYLWTVQGPGEFNVRWIADEVASEPNRHIAWRTRPGSIVENEGKVTFERRGDDATVIHVHLDYSPPAGALGHVVASLFGADPKSELDGDLVRMKSMLETGHAPWDAARRQGEYSITG